MDLQREQRHTVVVVAFFVATLLCSASLTRRAPDGPAELAGGGRSLQP